MKSAGRRNVGHVGAVVLAATLVLAAAGCTTDKKSSDTSTSSAGTSSTTAAGTKATGTPVKIGFTSGGTGATAIPEIGRGAQLAADFINDHENGINGHPIDLVYCPTDGTPESSAACANKLVSEGAVGVIDGADVGTDAKIPILHDAGIATMGSGTIGTGQSLSQDAFFFAPPATTFPPAQVDLAAKVGAKHVSFVFPDIPQVPLLQGLITKQAQLDGIQADVVTFDPAAPDFDAAMATVMSNGSDALATIATDEWCTGLVKAARAADFQGSINVGQCIEYAAALSNADAKGIYSQSSAWGPAARKYAPEVTQTVIDQYAAAMDEAGRGDGVVGLDWTGWVSVWQSAGVLRTIKGDLTAASVMTGMRALKDATNDVGPPITCDPRPSPGFSGCTEGWQWYQMQDNGTLKPISGGFIKPNS